MRLTIRVLGVTLLDLTLNEDEADETDDGGSITAYPVGFTAPHGDQRWSEVECPDYTGDDE